MNKGDLVQAVSELLESKKEAKQAVDCVFDTIQKALQVGDSVQVLGFGTFKVQKNQGQTGAQPPDRRDHPNPSQKHP